MLFIICFYLTGVALAAILLIALKPGAGRHRASLSNNFDVALAFGVTVS